MSDIETQTTLRDQLASAFTQVEEAPEADTSVDQEVQAERSDIAPERADGRVRDPATGKFVAQERQETQAPERKPIKIRDRDVEWWNKPSTWKPDLAPQWDNAPDELKQYLHTREADFAHGVSTYKQEWERARPLLEAISPYMPTLQQYGIQPEQHVQRLFNAHQTLALGSPEQKLAMFQQIAREYQVPLQSLFTQGEDGQMRFTAPQQPAGPTPEQIQRLIDQRVNEGLSVQTSRQAIESFVSAKGDNGQPRYPHFEQVRQTMAGLLEAKLAQDLPSAYEAAIRMPAHADIYATIQQQEREAKEAADRQAAQEKVTRARNAAVSTRSQTPSAPGNGQTAKGLRNQLEAAFDQLGGGRV